MPATSRRARRDPGIGLSYPGIFVSNVRCGGDLAGVFEQEGPSAHFYLYDLTRAEGRKVVRQLRIGYLPPDLQEKEVDVQWDDDQIMVALFIRKKLRAAFDVRSATA